jgi:hypothetical protein
MAKYDDVTLDTAWNGTLEVLNQFGDGTPPTDLVRAEAFGGLADIVSNGVWVGPPREHGSGDDPPDEWIANYYRYLVTVLAPPAVGPDTTTIEVFLWNGDSLVPGPTGVLPIPAGGVVIEGTGFSGDFAMSITDLTIHGNATDATPAERGFLWFGDRTFSEAWFSTVDTTVTVTFTGAWGELSATGIIGFTPGEILFGTNVAVITTMAADHFISAGSIINRISNLSWDLASTSLDNLDLFKPGDAGGIVDSDNAPGWSRIASVADRARVSNIGGMAMFAEGAFVSSTTWTGKIFAPFLVTFKPNDGKFGYN